MLYCIQAMAKLHGSYENLMHGSIEYALRDLTAGHVNTNYWQYRAGTMGAPEILTVIGDAITNSLQTQQLQQQQQQQPYDWLYDHMTTALAQGHAMSAWGHLLKL
eukprot:12497-Heterococcus_DN1.PRE.1